MAKKLEESKLKPESPGKANRAIQINGFHSPLTAQLAFLDKELDTYVRVRVSK